MRDEEAGEGERGAGLMSFVAGVALGVALGLLLAPEDGEAFRGKLAGRLRALRGLAAGTVGDLGPLVVDAVAPEREHSRPARPRPSQRPGRLH